MGDRCGDFGRDPLLQLVQESPLPERRLTGSIPKTGYFFDQSGKLMSKASRGDRA
jgi:hypothetical protein